MAQIRVTDRQLPPDEDGGVRRVVEIIVDGKPVGRLPVTAASYDVGITGLSLLKLTLVGGRAAMDSRPPRSSEAPHA